MNKFDSDSQPSPAVGCKKNDHVFLTDSAPTQSAVNQAAGETPRTDSEAEYQGANIDQVSAMTTLARTLECELNAVSLNAIEQMEARHEADKRAATFESQLAKLSAERETAYEQARIFAKAADNHKAAELALQQKVDLLTKQVDDYGNLWASRDADAKIAETALDTAIQQNEEMRGRIENGMAHTREQNLRIDDQSRLLIERAEQLSAALAMVEAMRGALEMAVNTVECDSLDKDGNCLPWYRAARSALTPEAPTDKK